MLRGATICAPGVEKRQKNSNVGSKYSPVYWYDTGLQMFLNFHHCGQNISTSLTQVTPSELPTPSLTLLKSSDTPKTKLLS